MKKLMMMLAVSLAAVLVSASSASANYLTWRTCCHNDTYAPGFLRYDEAAYLTAAGLNNRGHGNLLRWNAIARYSDRYVKLGVRTTTGLLMYSLVKQTDPYGLVPDYGWIATQYDVYINHQ